MAEPTTEELILRRLLWIRHHETMEGLYGDDGELQCSRCMIDFKRMPAAEIEKRFQEQGIAKLREQGVLIDRKHTTQGNYNRQ